MAKQTIQIADKPTLDTVAENVTELKESAAKQTSVEELVAEVETLKTELENLKSTVSTINTNVSTVKNTVESIDGNFEVNSYTLDSGVTKTGTGKGTLRIEGRLNKIIIDGVNIVHHMSLATSRFTYDNNYFYFYTIPFCSSYSITTSAECEITELKESE